MAVHLRLTSVMQCAATTPLTNVDGHLDNEDEIIPCRHSICDAIVVD